MNNQVIHHLSPGDHTQATAPAQVKASRLQKSGGNHEEFTNHRVGHGHGGHGHGISHSW